MQAKPSPPAQLLPWLPSNSSEANVGRSLDTQSRSSLFQGPIKKKKKKGAY